MDRRIPANAITLIRYERCRRSLAEFIKAAWHLIEPGEYCHNWHVDVIAEHLEAVTRGEIKRLLVNMPPRFMKSTAINVLWPCWEWLERPDVKYLTSSYDDELAVRDNVRSRDLMKTPWYRGLMAYCQGLSGNDPWQFKGDQNVKGRYENTRSGHRIATSVGGAATGEGGNRVMCDDPLSAKGGLSKAKRDEARTWWDRTMSTRLNDQRHDAMIMVMQRLHEEDPSGHILQQGGYDHLFLPMEYRAQVRINGIDICPKDYPTSIGYVDPRTEDGELLWKERFPPEVIARLRTALGPIGYAGQCQQSPVAEGGNMFQREWFEIVEAAPIARIGDRVRYWDKAGTEGGGKRTAGVLMCRGADGVFYIEDVIKGHWGAANREKVIRQTAEADRAKYGHVTTWVEQEPGSGGKESAETTIKNLAGFDIRAERVTGEKEVRATPMAVQASIGAVKLVRGAWNKDFLDEGEAFPMGEFKDQVDAASGALNKLALIPWGEFGVWDT